MAARFLQQLPWNKGKGKEGASNPSRRHAAAFKKRIFRTPTDNLCSECATVDFYSIFEPAVPLGPGQSLKHLEDARTIEFGPRLLGKGYGLRTCLLCELVVQCALRTDVDIMKLVSIRIRPLFTWSSTRESESNQLESSVPQPVHSGRWQILP